MNATDRLIPEPDLLPLLSELVAVDRTAVAPEQQRLEYMEFVDMFRGQEPTFPGVIRDEIIAADPSGRPVPVRRYLPTHQSNPGHVLVYLHGGGWVLGSLETHDRFTRAIAERLALEVISVDYRLAPENPFPAAFDDCACVVAHAAKDATWLAVAGDSAGGNLAAAISAHCAAAGSPVDAQVLIYPGLADHTSDDDQSRDGFGLDRAEVAYFWSCYCGSQQVDARLAPLLAPDPIPAPPTLISTAGCDPLERDGVEYAQRLIGAGVPTTYLPFPGLIHGWLDLAEQVPSSGHARDLLIEAIGQLRQRSSAAPAVSE
ncbi:MAG TPA: alpha/beta hydrolase [Ensifer sp.]|nr:alpha/beta hydrolase [Ensifer sp.]